jgi:arabinan endo-1,5-alpha-L-arabinosidase
MKASDLIAALSKCTVFFLLLQITLFADTKAYINPLKGDIGAHDPVMTKQDSTYYVFYTGDYILTKKSTDRINWKEISPVFKTCPTWFKTYVPANDGKNCWAPDISFRDGKYWLYYAVSTMGAKVSAIGLATNPTLNPGASNYKWTDEGMIMNSTTSNNYNCIDANCFVDTDGKVWLNFGSWNTGIKMVELNPQTGKLLSPTPTVYALAGRKNSSAIEAPFIIRHSTYYYLFVSWDNCCKGVQSTYNIRVGRASKVTGPYVDKSNVDMKTGSGGGTLIDKGDERWIGPGHNGIFTEHDTVFLVNHAYDANDNGNPKLMIRPLYWDKDGWPTLDATKGDAVDTKPKQRSVYRQPVSTIRPVVVTSNDHGCMVGGHAMLFTITGKGMAINSDSRIVPGIYFTR